MGTNGSKAELVAYIRACVGYEGITREEANEMLELVDLAIFEAEDKANYADN